VVRLSIAANKRIVWDPPEKKKMSWCPSSRKIENAEDGSARMTAVSSSTITRAGKEMGDDETKVEGTTQYTEVGNRSAIELSTKLSTPPPHFTGRRLPEEKASPPANKGTRNQEGESAIKGFLPLREILPANLHINIMVIVMKRVKGGEKGH